jgi:NADH:ubiquinone oxidoreductase subunit 5 (subunit L)/multisubunit Na+/H+ antiporter MnhA subunit
MMVIAVGLSSYNVALFHLINHAFYKALLFLGAGSVIHAVSDNQDFRKYGGLRAFLPLTYSVMLIASLSLVAFPVELFGGNCLIGVKLSNSGNTLKLLIPSLSQKATSG